MRSRILVAAMASTVLWGCSVNDIPATVTDSSVGPDAIADDSGDAAVNDASTSDVAVPDADQGDAADAAPCSLNDKRCLGDTPQSCDAQGVWNDVPCNGFCKATACVLPNSCTGGFATCGPNATGSCCSSQVVTGTTFNRSNNAAYPATISDFRLDKYEVTVERFRRFVNASKGTQASPPTATAGARSNVSASGWDVTWTGSLTANTTALKAALHCDNNFATWSDNPGSNEARPVNCVTWYEAFAFCVWDDARLPTEAEWNLAAAGGASQRVYPWVGSTIDETYASYYVDSTKRCYGDGTSGCAITDLVLGGAKPKGDGKYGQSNLAGNVWEWTLDWYADPYSASCTNCANTTPATGRVVRGGSYSTDATLLLTTYRSNSPPTVRDPTVGIRCSRDP